jgi:hypothetical protein
VQREQRAHRLRAVTAAVLLGRCHEIDDDRQPGRPQRVVVAAEPQRGDATAAVVADARNTPPPQLEQVGDGGTRGEDVVDRDPVDLDIQHVLAEHTIGTPRSCADRSSSCKDSELMIARRRGAARAMPA